VFINIVLIPFIYICEPNKIITIREILTLIQRIQSDHSDRVSQSQVAPHLIFSGLLHQVRKERDLLK